nr:hypothetical protein [Paracoccus saliphilus]
MRKNNFGGTRAPGSTDDVSLGYERGSRWWDGSRWWSCRSNASASAIWAPEDIKTSYETKAALAVLDAEVNLPLGMMATVDGVQYLKMQASHPQYGSNPIPDLPGWITATAVSSEVIRAQWRISDVFGGAWRALETRETIDTDPYSGSRTTQAISRIVSGSGSNGPATADSALHLMVKKADVYGASPGEIDTLRINVFQDGHSDCGGILIGAYKKIGDGTSSEGGVTPIEVSMRRFLDNVNVPVAKHQFIPAFSPNPQSAWGGRGAIGAYSENHIGAGFANFLGIADGETAGDASMEYLIAGFGRRDLTTRYFSVTPAAKMDLISYDAGGSAAPTLDRMRASSSPATNDLLGEDLYRGRNSAAEDVVYARAYAAIKGVIDGTEDGIFRIEVMVNGILARQFSAENGVSIGSTPTQGTGTLNAQAGLLVNAQTVVDGGGGIRFPSFGATALASATSGVNTNHKVAGKAIWDATNGRVLVASGADPTSPWALTTGQVAITPA